MVKLTLCLIVFGLTWGFLIVLIVVLRNSNPRNDSLLDYATRAYEKISEARDRRERILVAVVYGAVLLLRSGFYSAALACAGAAFTALGAICGDWSGLAVIVELLLKVYDSV